MKYIVSAFAILFLFCACTGNYKSDKIDLEKPPPPALSPFKNYLGINAFEWDFVEDKQSNIISESKMSVIRSFGAIRHYLDWERLEQDEGKYTFNPTHSGDAYLDVLYEKMKTEGMDALVCIKTIPVWLMNTYPSDERDHENVPAAYGTDRSKPASYIQQARVGFQFAARYGSNKNLDSSLVKVDSKMRWPGDKSNSVRIGLNLIKYVECDNERDKWWKGKKAQQTAEEYAANLSAFYDGDKGKLGKNVGVKNADPNMQVVMGGLGEAKPEFVEGMIEWCKKNRGFKPDGKVNLCFDVINYHLYANDAYVNGGKATKGIAPELSEIGSVADKFIKMVNKDAPGMEIWVTETGYDVGKTPQSAIKIGAKSTFITQADWNLRTALLYARHGISRCMFYMLDDAGGLDNPVQYSSSGFHDDFKRRPSADYFLQTKKLLGNYRYKKTISNEPIVDLYKLNNKEIYVLTVPDQKDKKVVYQLNLGNTQQAIIHNLQVGKNVMAVKKVKAKNGKLAITVTETPVFVEKI